jgi:plastocyanin
MKKYVIIAALVVGIAGGALLALTLGGNKDETSNKNDSSMKSMDMNSDASAVSDTRVMSTDKVQISGFAFSPKNITVKKGTTVTWTNKDSAVHNVTESDSQDGPKSGSLSQGQSYSFTYNSAGTFNYECTIHPGMTGTVTVTE